MRVSSSLTRSRESAKSAAYLRLIMSFAVRRFVKQEPAFMEYQADKHTKAI